MALDRVKTKANIDKFIRANKIPEAIREVQKLVEDNPRDTVTLQQLANLYLKMQNKDSAVPIFIRIAELYHKDGFTPKALASIKIALREAPDNTQAQELYASFAEQTGMQRDALEAYEKLVTSYMKNGILDKAEKILDKLLELGPDSVRYQLQHGDLLVRLNKKEQAVPSYLKAAENLVNQGMIKEAAKIFERVLQIDPKKLQALEHAVRNLLAQKEPQKAIELLDGIVQGKPAPPIINEIRIDILTSTGNFRKAEEIMAGILQKTPLRGGILAKFLRLNMAQKKFQEAAQVLMAEVEKAEPASLKEFEGGFEELLGVAPTLDAAYEGLISVCRKQGSNAKLQTTLVKYSDILTNAGDLENAARVLKDALGLAPSDNTLMLKLEEIEERMGVKKAPAPEPATAEAGRDESTKSEFYPTPEPVREAPEVEIEVEIEDIAPQQAPASPPSMQEVEVTSTFSAPPRVTEDFASSEQEGGSSDEESEEMEISVEFTAEGETMQPVRDSEEYGESAEKEAPEEPKAVRAPKKLDSEAAGKIQERLSEAQIFLKYGLVEKAIGELQAVLKEVPDHIQAHQKLIGIFRSMDKKDKLVRQILKLAAVFRDQGDRDTCDNLLDEARGIDPNHKAIADFEVAGAGKGPEKIESAKDIDSLARMMQGKKPAPAAPKEEAPSMELVEEEEPEIVEEQLEKEDEEIDIEIGAPDASDTGSEKFVEVEESATTTPTPQQIITQAESEPETAPEEEESLRVEISGEEISRSSELGEKLEEAEFYFAQELWEDANRIAAELTEKFPADLRVQNLTKRLEEQGHMISVTEGIQAAPEEISAQEARAEEPSREQDDLSLLDSELVKGLGGVVPAERKKGRVKVTLRDIIPEEESAKKEEEQPLQETGEQYYDLAKELGAALEGLEGTASDLFDEEESAEKSPEEMSFEEVFKEFKKGVEKKVPEEDFDTHYNLGIAYKEMELVEEAIGEFQIAAKSPIYFADACAMLGKCFQIKGMADLSEKWYRKGLDSKGFPEDVYNGLRYDLAELLETQGKNKDALAIYKEVYASNANYRDVKDKIDSLK
ncbi:MAG TPA: tetratricopeptide repeat protein [Acidobacteriota bacterium]|nr:tetratricopeptide repeat protein [Acidobacteriota bacterium]HNT18489.1 tetratricopeptide repeat protein [Acidobacteriota bacterium]